MAANPAATARIRSDARSSARQRSTETKSAPKTTEFFLTLAAIIGILVAAAIITSGDNPNDTDQFIARQAWLYVTILVAAYTVGRGLAKSGSREFTGDHESGEHGH